MATLNFIIKGKKNPSTIFLRFKHGRKFDITTSTSLLVNPNHWSKVKQRIKPLADAKDKDFINSKLDKLRSVVLEKFNRDYSTGKLVNREWLKMQIELFFNRSVSTNEHEIYFTSYIEYFINKAPTRYLRDKQRPVLKSTIAKYKSTWNRLKQYEEKLNRRFRLEEIDLKFHKDYLVFMLDELKYGGNTVGKDITQIKMFCREAKTDGLYISPQVENRKFYIPSAKTKDVYLNDDEITRIFEFDFEGNDRLNNVRDLFIIGSRTGLRVSDFMRLKTNNLKKDMIQIETMKTGKEVSIPLHSQVKETLAKREGKFPHKISVQKFNSYLKEVCKNVGIKEVVEGKLMNVETKRKEFGKYEKYKLISSHTCRRSFASNLYGKLPTAVIMAITGHSTEKSFLKYIKITPQEHAKTLDKFWKQQLQDFSNNDDNKTLKIVK